MVGRERPDLVLLDVCLGEEHGFDLVEWMAQECPRVRCALMSAHCTSAMALRAAKASICGFIDKTYAGMEQFAAALRCLAQGDSYYSASYTEMLRRLRMDQRGYDKLLTDREQEVLALVGCGWSDDAISDSLGMALATAQTHRRNIMAKLGINNAPKLMRYAIDRGLTQFPQKSTESIALIY